MATAIVPDFRAFVMAVNRVERLLRKVTAALNAAGIDYAVVGGNAVAAWVATVDQDAVRTTKDVDILLRRPDLQRVADVLAPLGFVMHEVLGVYMFVGRRRPSPKTGVHVILAREKVRSHDTHAVPDPSQYVVTREGFRVIALAELVAMKLQAYRLIDRAHLVDLRNVGLVTPDLIASLPPDLHERWAALNREEPESR